MKQIKIISVALFSIVLLCACPHKEGQRFITFINNSDRNIRCQELWGMNTTIADSIYQCRIITNKILADSSYIFECSIRDYGWEESFKYIPFLQFLIMDDSTFVYYDRLNNSDVENCDIVRQNVPVLYVYRLTLEDLQGMNWTVVYPPENTLNYNYGGGR